jgi:hypothetical protein
MWKEHPGLRHESDDEVANRRTASLGGLAITLFLAVLGLSLVRGLAAKDTLRDCLSSGRMNCDPGFDGTGIFNAASDLIRATTQSARQPSS